MYRILLLALFLCAPMAAHARTLEGVELAETIGARDGTGLQLHGAGVRDKFIFDIYVGALYLPTTGLDAAAILEGGRPARIEMHFLYSEVEAAKLESAWRDGFAGNNDPARVERIAARIDRFVALFPTAVEGDVFVLEYLPEQGTQVRINGEVAGSIEGDDFFTALLGVFLGPEPADHDLRDGMLGSE